MLKELLLTPGPTPVPERIHRAMAITIHHRTDTFKHILEETLNAFAELIDATTRPIFLAGSGTAAMDATLQNITRKGDKIIVLNAGKFGERWVEIAQSLELECIELAAPWGGSPSQSEISEVLRTHNDAVAFCAQYCETSTTTLHPIPDISKLLRIHAPDILFVVDAITAVGVVPISMQKLGIDVLITGSQKALMLPPGLAMLALSARSWERVETIEPRTYYFNLLTERAMHAKGTTAWTPATTLIIGLQEALAMLNEEGFEQVYSRHARFAEATRAGFRALGLTLLAPNYPSPALTGGIPADSIDPEKVRARMTQQFGVRMAGGQGRFKGKVIRMGHMGYINQEDITSGLAALGDALQAEGSRTAPDAGVAAALNAL